MNNKLSIPFAIVLAGIIIAGAVIYRAGSNEVGQLKKDSGTASVAAQTGEPAGQASPAAPTIGDDVVLGDPNAPVTFIEFGDFQCPFCGQFYNETEKKLRDEYVKTGKMRIVFRDFPLLSIHPYAQPAAEAAECAKDQGKFWLYHDAIFDRQSQLATLDFTALAAELGLNKDLFSQCLKSGKVKPEIAQDLKDGEAAGVSGTPASFINGTLISGAYPYEAFKQAIDTALKSNK